MIPDLFLSLLIWIGATLLAAGIAYVVCMGIWAIWAGEHRDP